MMKCFSIILQFLIAGMLMWVAPFASAQTYPNKPIRIILPFAAGGATSVLARLIGNKLTERWGQQVLADNRPGANGFIAGEALMKAVADGYTLMLVSPSHIITPLLIHAPYQPINDFAPVATVGSTAFGLFVHPSVQATTLQEFIALAKAKPDQLNYATTGTGGISHLTTEMFALMAGIKMHHIPYKGAGPVVTDLMGGQVHLHIGTPAALVPHVKSGKLKAIAVSGETRMPALSEVPTFIEGGLSGFSMTSWYGILAPASTPRPIIEKLSAEIAKSVALPDVKEKLLALGMDPFISSSQQFSELMKTDTDKFANVIKSAKIKVD